MLENFINSLQVSWQNKWDNVAKNEDIFYPACVLTTIQPYKTTNATMSRFINQEASLNTTM